MNKLVSAISLVALCSFAFISTAEAAKHKHGGAKHHTKHHHAARHHHRLAHGSRHRYHGDERHGLASWYGGRFQGRKTANGERYDMNELTAAHNTLPLSSYAEVTNLNNHRSVIVRINDRGPHHSKRVMDLSYAAAKELGIHKSGTASVQIRPLFENPTLSQLDDQPG